MAAKGPRKSRLSQAPQGRGRRPLAGAWRLLAALVVLGLVSLLMYDPIFPKQGLWETILAANSPRWLAQELVKGFPAVGRARAGAEVLPEEIRLVAQALRQLGATEYTMVGKMKEDSYIQQRSGEFIYPILQRKQGAPYVVGRVEDVEAQKARIVWRKRGVAIGLADK